MKHTIDLRKKPTEAKASSKEAKNFKLKSREITWHAPSFYYNPQKRYLASIIIALLLGAVAILFLQKDTLSAVFLIMSSLVLILYANKRPEINKIIIDDYGIRVGGNSFLFSELRSFWIEYMPGENKELSLESKKWYLPYVKVSLENQNPLEIRSWLVSFLPEREHEKSLVDLISRRIGL